MAESLLRLDPREEHQGVGSNCRDVWALLRVTPQSQERYIEDVDRFCPHVQCYYPVYMRTIRPHGARKIRKVPWPVFPGYLFMRVTNRDLSQLVSLPVRAYWIRFGGVIDVIPDKVVERLRKLELAGDLIREVVYVNPYRSGVSVRVHLPVGDILAVVVKRMGERVLVDSPLCRVVVPGHLLEVV